MQKQQSYRKSASATRQSVVIRITDKHIYLRITKDVENYLNDTVDLVAGRSSPVGHDQFISNFEYSEKAYMQIKLPQVELYQVYFIITEIQTFLYSLDIHNVYSLSLIAKIYSRIIYCDRSIRMSIND